MRWATTFHTVLCTMALDSISFCSMSNGITYSEEAVIALTTGLYDWGTRQCDRPNIDPHPYVMSPVGLLEWREYAMWLSVIDMGTVR